MLEVLEEDSLPARTGRLLSLADNMDITVEQLSGSLEVEAHRPLPDDVTVLLLKRE